MIDWLHLLVNSLWILACAIALGTVSYASWEASTIHGKIQNILSIPKYQMPLNFAGIFFSIGMAGTSGKWWEISLRVFFAFYFLWQTLRVFIHKSKRNDAILKS